MNIQESTKNKFSSRQAHLAELMKEIGIDIAFLCNEDNVYYYSGFYNYLDVDFGRPTILSINSEGRSVLITPAIEKVLAETIAVVEDIQLWQDGVDGEWRKHLENILSKNPVLGLEMDLMPGLVRNYIYSNIVREQCQDIMPKIKSMRIIKTNEELNIARHAGQVGMAMMEASRSMIEPGIPEYKIALAATQAGTEKAASILEKHYPNETMISPNIHYMQIMASGEEISMTHHRASTKKLKYGEPVFLCFCGMTNFNRFKLGFDRTFWLGKISDTSQESIYETALESQSAAIAMLKPGVRAEEVHQAYAEVIQSKGYDFPFRCGRATGYSFVEFPQLAPGDETKLEPGMVFAVDGSITAPTGFRAQVGDSFIITKTGYEQITIHPKETSKIII